MDQSQCLYNGCNECTLNSQTIWPKKCSFSKSANEPPADQLPENSISVIFCKILLHQELCKSPWELVQSGPFQERPSDHQLTIPAYLEGGISVALKPSLCTGHLGPWPGWELVGREVQRQALCLGSELPLLSPQPCPSEVLPVPLFWNQLHFSILPFLFSGRALSIPPLSPPYQELFLPTLGAPSSRRQSTLVTQRSSRPGPVI